MRWSSLQSTARPRSAGRGVTSTGAAVLRLLLGAAPARLELRTGRAVLFLHLVGQSVPDGVGSVRLRIGKEIESLQEPVDDVLEGGQVIDDVRSPPVRVVEPLRCIDLRRGEKIGAYDLVFRPAVESHRALIRVVAKSELEPRHVEGLERGAVR